MCSSRLLCVAADRYPMCSRRQVFQAYVQQEAAILGICAADRRKACSSYPMCSSRQRQAATLCVAVSNLTQVCVAVIWHAAQVCMVVFVVYDVRTASQTTTRSSYGILLRVIITTQLTYLVGYRFMLLSFGAPQGIGTKGILIQFFKGYKHKMGT